ncbi:MAG TPA: hypothetical protein VFV01_47980 [Spirillospora sp.]|nr:hypothetical protein [Spirillospora sp.]
MVTITNREEERVAAGAAVLDKVRPDWFEYVDLPALDVRSCADCTLGQLFGEYQDGLIRLFGQPGGVEATAWAGEHGFELDPADPRSPGAQYEALTDAWTALIKARRAHRDGAVQ